MSATCPSCLSETLGKSLYFRANVPVFNNVVYESPESAKSCIKGRIRLLQCRRCGLIFNTDFSEDLIIYDRHYNSERSFSSVYQDYLKSISLFCSSWLKPDSIVLEIGCGTGDFLKQLSDIAGCYAAGYDTTYRGDSCYKKRVLFHKNHFLPGAEDGSYDMLVLRHVLEHIKSPYHFMRQLCTDKVLRKGAKIIIEVPSFDWILENRTFYDITYEHSNYFSGDSLNNLLSLIGIKVEKIDYVFGRQYILVVGTYTGENKGYPASPPSLLKKELLDKFVSHKQNLVDVIKGSGNVCVWGASGKGVIFLSQIPDDALKGIIYVIDINPSKQGKYLPVTGKKIDSPAVLSYERKKLLVIIMNEIYKSEIMARLNSMGVQASFICGR